MSGSALHDQLFAERRRIRAAWQVRAPKAPKPAPIPAGPAVFPPLPRKNIKSVEERLAEAEAFRGELSDKAVNDIRITILRSARDFKEDAPRRCAIGRIKCVIANHFDIPAEQIVSGKQTSKSQLARQIAMYIATQITRRSNEDIGDLLGGKDPSTVSKGVQKIEREMAANPAFAEEIAVLKRMLES